MKKLIACLLAFAMLGAMLCGCAKNAPTAQDNTEQSGTAAQSGTEQPDPAAQDGTGQTEPAAQPQQGGASDTGDASLDDPRNQDGIGEKELLVVSAGTSYNDSRREDIGAIETALAEAFPEWTVRRAFTNQKVIDTVKARDGETIDNVHDALERAVRNGVKELVIQPTHLMNGLEYGSMETELANYKSSFAYAAIGKPLFSSDDDLDMMGAIFAMLMGQYDDGKTAICFVGRGSTAPSNDIYARMRDMMIAGGCVDYYVGTVGATPSLADVTALVKAGAYERVVLHPMTITSGALANEDMAGDEADSWKSAFEKEGYEVVCVTEGLGRVAEVQSLLVEHAQAVIKTAG